MPDEIQKLLSEYIAEHRAGGEADPLAYLERADEGDRGELAALIDGYLARSPGREWDPDAYAGSAAERVADELGKALLGSSGLWPAILPRLRKQARLTRAQVVERLSAALGAAGREQKVAAYYHEMEQGSLDSQRRVRSGARGARRDLLDHGREAARDRRAGRRPAAGRGRSAGPRDGPDHASLGRLRPRRPGRAQIRAGGAGGGEGRDRRTVHGRPIAGRPFV